MEQYVIYEKPADFPEHFVVRCWLISRQGPVPTDRVWKAPTLESARTVVPDGFYRLPRFADDDPVIVEVWT